MAQPTQWPQRESEIQIIRDLVSFLESAAH